MKPLPLLLTLVGLSTGLFAESAKDRIQSRPDGGTVVRPVQPDPSVENPWPEKYLTEYYQRVSRFGAAMKGKNNAATEREHEKWGLPDSFSSFIGGDYDAALAAMQAGDLQAGYDHAHTRGIDFYWCFTLKGQAHKYFYYGQNFDPAYKQTMFEGARLWTANDPRPSLELVGLLDSDDPLVVETAIGLLSKMWRSPDDVRAMADAAIAEGHPNKKRFGDYMHSIADKLPPSRPVTADEWQAWWTLIAGFGVDNSWMIFEEYERRCNPNPHPKWGIGKGPVGGAWDPETRGMWSDARNTDNLRGMRETAVYLFAEETGNEAVRRLYKAKIKASALKYLAVGNGEWDSEGYLAHTMSAYVNTYAFAKDKEVRLYSKAILDYLFLSAAKKYYRGSWGGPVKRDYGDHAPFSGSAAATSIFFGDYPGEAHHERDVSLLINSGYLPPAAVVALARREFPRPVEIFSSHPTYEVMLPGNDERPGFFETMYYGKTYQIGTLTQGHGYDLNGFKVLTHNSHTGADFFIPSTHGGKVRNPVIDRGGADRVGQFENLVIWLNTGAAGFNFLHPKSAQIETVGDTRLFRLEKTNLAVVPVSLEFGEIPAKPAGKLNAASTLLPAKPTAALSGFVLIADDGDLNAFKAALAKGRLQVEGNKVSYTDAQGKTLAVEHVAGEPRVWRNGVEQDWEKRFALFQPADGSENPCYLGWKERRMHVQAGGHVFEAELKPDGTYTFSNQLAE